MFNQQPDQQQLVRDVVNFMTNSKPNQHERNVAAARSIVGKHGVSAVAGGFKWAVEELQEIYTSYPPGVVFGESENFISLLADLTMGADSYASAYLSAVIKIQGGEDMPTLAALVASRSPFPDPSLIGYYEGVYSGLISTGRKLALALAIFACGEKKYLLQHIQEGFFGSVLEYEEVLRQTRLMAPLAPGDSATFAAIARFAAPEIIPGSPPESWALTRMLALDIASKGREHMGPPGSPRWQRKE